MSASPQKADIIGRECDARYGPSADVRTLVFVGMRQKLLLVSAIGQEPTLSAAPPLVRSAPESGHPIWPQPCLLSANSGHPASSLFDHFVCAHEHGRWHIDAHWFRGSQIYDQLELGRSLDRHVGRFRPPQ
jgi:hypothetical protein